MSYSYQIKVHLCSNCNEVKEWDWNKVTNVLKLCWSVGCQSTLTGSLEVSHVDLFSICFLLESSYFIISVKKVFDLTPWKAIHICWTYKWLSRANTCDHIHTFTCNQASVSLCLCQIVLCLFQTLKPLRSVQVLAVSNLCFLDARDSFYQAS